jgi:hypothetical protein
MTTFPKTVPKWADVIARIQLDPCRFLKIREHCGARERVINGDSHVTSLSSVDLVDQPSIGRPG